MNPSDAHSSLAALRQLKEMLDAGTITPAEFETLKRQIVFGVEPALPLEPSMPAATEPFSPPPTAAYPPPTAAEVPAAYVPEENREPFAAPLPPANPPAETEWLAADPDSLPDDDDTVPPLEEERRNPLNLIFALGGLLVFLGVIAYLMLGRPATPNEHLTSASQTAADSTATVPEVGPQAEQLNLPPAAAPETIRVAPVMRAAPASNQFSTDSAAAPAVASPAPAATAAPASKAPATPATTVTDSTSTTKTP